jgi:putative ABC transport system permease protein
MGITVGIAAVLLLVSLGEGARDYVIEEFGGLGANLVIVIPGKAETTGGAPPPTGGVVRDLTIDDATIVERRSPSVRATAPISLGSAPIKYADRGRNVPILGATPSYLEIRQLHVASGLPLPDTDPRQGARVCLIGRTVQQELFAGENPLGRVVRIGEWRFRVIGVLERKGQSLGLDFDDLVIVPVGTGLRLFNQTGLFRIIAQATSSAAVPSASAEVRAILTERHDGHEDFTVITQDAVLSAFGDILTTLTMAVGGIAAISLCVAGIGVMNVMLVSVTERVPEVGLLKAVGARNGQILAAFLVEAVMLTVVGGLAGVGVGMLGTAGIRWMFPALPASVPGWVVVLAVGVSAVVGLVFGVMPARRASRIAPVAALGRGL